MAVLTERQIKELDIDWYCLVGGVPTHIASMGGMIPVQFRDRVKLRLIQNEVAKMEPFVDVRLNMENILKQTANGYEYLEDETVRLAVEQANNNHPGFRFLSEHNLPVRLFAATFVEKARRGFRSFARQESGNENEYILIAEPANHVEYSGGKVSLEELKCKISDNNTRLVI